MEKAPIVCAQFSEMHCNSNTNLDGFTKDRAGVMGRLYNTVVYLLQLSTRSKAILQLTC